LSKSGSYGHGCKELELYMNGLAHEYMCFDGHTFGYTLKETGLYIANIERRSLSMCPFMYHNLARHLRDKKVEQKYLELYYPQIALKQASLL